MSKKKSLNGGLALVRMVSAWEKAKAKVDLLFWNSAPLAAQKNARRPRDQLARRISRILRTVGKRSQGAP